MLTSTTVMADVAISGMEETRPRAPELPLPPAVVVDLVELWEPVALEPVVELEPAAVELREHAEGLVEVR